MPWKAAAFSPFSIKPEKGLERIYASWDGIPTPKKAGEHSSSEIPPAVDFDTQLNDQGENLTYANYLLQNRITSDPRVGRERWNLTNSAPIDNAYGTHGGMIDEQLEDWPSYTADPAQLNGIGTHLIDPLEDDPTRLFMIRTDWPPEEMNYGSSAMPTDLINSQTPPSLSPPSVFTDPVEKLGNWSCQDLSSRNDPQITHSSRQSVGPNMSKCDHCNQTIGRKNDIKRHMVEQHQCPFPGCQNYCSTSGDQLEIHLRTKHNSTRERFKCGTCGKTFIRAEKLKKHLLDTHKMRRAHWDEFRCLEIPCYTAGSDVSGGTYFAIRTDLDNHLSDHHAIGHATYHQGGKVLSNNAGNVEKRSWDQGPESDAKRPKAGIATKDLSSLSGSKAPQILEVEQPVSSDTDQPIHSEAPMVLDSAPGDRSRSDKHPLVSTEVLPLTGREMCHLRELHAVKEDMKELESRNIAASFSIKKKALTLRGPCSPEELHEAILGVETHLKNLRLSKTFKIPNERSGQIQVPSKPIRRSTDKKIAPIDSNDDSGVLKAWNLLLPALPKFLEDCINGVRYSASLVRLMGSDGNFAPTIRIQSPLGQSKDARAHIRLRVQNFLRDHRQCNISVSFQQGWLSRLAGEFLEDDDPIEDDDPPTDDIKFFHYRRYWKTPGMGASIGMSDCKKISATLGGYILVGGKKHMLSVDHFVRRAKNAHNVTDYKISSPSPGDVAQLRLDVEDKLNQLEHQLSLAAPEDSIPFEQLGNLYTQTARAEIGHFEQFKKDLNRAQEDYEFGSLVWTSGENTIREQIRAQPTDTERIMHRMDWAVFTVNDDREGKNLYRHGLTADPGLKDFENEKWNAYGMGDECIEAGELQAGDKVHYVGQTSGFLRGTINAAKVLFRDEGGLSQEWAMTVSDCSHAEAHGFEGDSGAWVIRDDNKLVGLLWALSNGQLILTPIHDVFADIKRASGEDDVCLPRPPRRSSAPRSTPQGQSRICREFDLSESRHKSRWNRAERLATKRREPRLQLPSIADLLNPVASSAEPSPDGAPSPVPSLTLSSPSDSDSPSPVPPSPMLHESSPNRAFLGGEPAVYTPEESSHDELVQQEVIALRESQNHTLEKMLRSKGAPFESTLEEASLSGLTQSSPAWPSSRDPVIIHTTAAS